MIPASAIAGRLAGWHKVVKNGFETGAQYKVFFGKHFKQVVPCVHLSTGPLEGPNDQWKKQILAEKILKSPFPAIPTPETSYTEFMFTLMEKHRNNTMLINGITDSKLSYHDTLRLATKTASYLLKKGFRAGDRVAIYSYNDPMYFVAFMGILAAGGISVDINPNYTQSELKRQIDDTGCVYLFTHSECAAAAKKVAAETPAIKEVIVFGQSGGCVPFSHVLEDDGTSFKGLSSMKDPRKVIAQMPGSSGTTGIPKSVCKSHYSMTAMALSGDNEDLIMNRAGDCGLLVLPLYHIFPLMLIMMDAVPGSANVLLPKFIPETFLLAIQKHKVTSMPIVPPLILFLLQHGLVSQFDISSLKSIICGAAPISKETLMEFKEKLNLRCVRQGYGMTEICPITIGLNSSKDPSNVGVPIRNTEVKFIDVDTKQLLGPNEPGEIIARSPCMFNGYWDNPAATEATIDNEGWIHTGDIGYYDKDGFVYVVDRLKDLIKYKGHQVAPAELEGILLTFEGVKDVAVIGIPDEKAGELPRAYVVLEQGKQITEKQLCDYVAGQTATEKHLYGGVKFVEIIPKSAAGKILKKELRAKL